MTSTPAARLARWFVHEFIGARENEATRCRACGSEVAPFQGIRATNGSYCNNECADDYAERCV